MHEHGECPEDVMDNTKITFDKGIILKELNNIVNGISDEEFAENAPKFKGVKWIPMFKSMKQAILDEMTQELNEMWKYENLSEKCMLLEKQKDKFSDLDPNAKAWRPTLGDVKSQLRAHDIANLQQQKKLLETQVEEYESRVHKLKTKVSAKRGYIETLLSDVQICLKKNEELQSTINAILENHKNYIKCVINSPAENLDNSWTDNDET